MSEHKRKKHRDTGARTVAVLLCGGIFASTFFMYPYETPKDNAVTALADSEKKGMEWEKQAVPAGTTIDAEFLWPDEMDPEFTAVYRDGQLIDDKMITITAGSVYHFRGRSGNTALYTEVYPGDIRESEESSGKAGIWYRLLPSAVRNDFEQDGWTWDEESGQEERAVLDKENKSIHIKSGDDAAVLYGMGLYLDDAHGYNDDKVFSEEGGAFKSAFGESDNLFASAVEYYHTKGGELKSICPGIHSFMADALSQNAVVERPEETQSPDIDTQSGPVLLKDMTEYVNGKRAEAGLEPITWDSADDENIMARINAYSDTSEPVHEYPESAYTDAVMCEIFLDNVYSMDDVYYCAESYFLTEEVKSFNCVLHDGIGVLVFVW